MTILSGIPPELSNCLFCGWRYEKRNGRQTKIPINPRTGGMAQANNPDTFAPLSVAAAAAEHYDGLGVGIFGQLGAIDIDHCVTDGRLSEMACDIVNTMDSYSEYSPSGEGVRILFWAEGFQYDKSRYYINNQRLGLEIYIAGATNKYVTVTGNSFYRRPMVQRGDRLKTVLERYMRRDTGRTDQAERWETPIPATRDELEDEALLQRARNARNGKRFSALWNGDISEFRSHSEADMALCNMLAFWTGRDAGRMDALFRRSGLMREKWDRPQSGSTYGALTIQNAIDSCREVYTPVVSGSAGPGRGSPEEQGPRLTLAADVPYEPPRWLLAPYFQRGKGTLIQGDNGSGKTAFMCAIAAHVSTGKPLCGLEVETPGNVLMISVEDDLPVLRGRIEACGGDLAHCYFLSNAAGLTFNSPEVEAAIREISARMIIFDPIQAFMGAGIDMFRSNETRPALAKLFEMCERNDCACAIVAHTGKSSGDKSPVNRSLGSVDIPAAMRSILQLIRNPDNEEECVMIHIKCSNAPKGRSLAYGIGDRGGVQWHGFSTLTVDDLTTIVKRKEKGVPYENEPLVQVFNQLVTEKPGFWSYADLKERGAKILGYPPFGSISDLRQKLDGPFCRELQEKDGLIVTCGCKSNGARGVRLELYECPQGFQTQLPEGQ